MLAFGYLKIKLMVIVRIVYILSHVSETQGYPIATVSEHQLFQGLIVYRLRRIIKNAK